MKGVLKMALIDDLKFTQTNVCTRENTAATVSVWNKARPQNLVVMMKNYWRTRQHLKQLNNLSEAGLRDIGLNYDDVRRLGLNAWRQEPSVMLEDAKQQHLRETRMAAVARFK